MGKGSGRCQLLGLTTLAYCPASWWLKLPGSYRCRLRAAALRIRTCLSTEELALWTLPRRSRETTPLKTETIMLVRLGLASLLGSN